MTDVLGPAAAGAVNTLTTTADVSNPTAGDTWFQDCVANNPATGTNLPSRFMNRLLQQARRIIRLTGVVESNTDDDMLGQAIQSGALNWAGTFGGTANALTAALSPVPTTLIPGLVVSGKTSAANTGATTLNVNGLGSVNVVAPNGGAFVGGEFIAAGQDASFLYDGANFVCVSKTYVAASAPFLNINGATQSLSNGVLTSVSAGSGTFAGVGTLASGVFTFSRTGVYSVFMAISGNLVSSGAAQLSFQLFSFHNGSDPIGNPRDLSEINAAGTVAPALTTSFVLFCNAGDTLQMSAQFSASASFTSAAVASCGMQIGIIQ